MRRIPEFNLIPLKVFNYMINLKKCSVNKLKTHQTQITDHLTAKRSPLDSAVQHL